MTDSFDIVGIGCAAVDDILYVDCFPAADEKTPVRRSERQCGGLTATALVAASRLGAKCAYAGVLGHDELSNFVTKTLLHENVDVRFVTRLSNARPVHSMIVVSARDRTRNIFFEIAGLTGAHDTNPDPELIRSARVLFLDHLGIAGGIRACRIAREAGVPIVADLERADMEGFQTLLATIDHPILSEKFALCLTGTSNAMDAVNALWNSDRKLAAVTVGRHGCWYRSPDEAGPVHCPAFAVDVVDSTGCGDVFHGAYAAALARGLTVSERIRFASAAAAMKATREGGQSGIPDRSAVEAFLRGKQ